MLTHIAVNPADDHCRIGSLEMPDWHYQSVVLDHCRIGSLEMITVGQRGIHIDHCRIGSLEIFQVLTLTNKGRSLPHRQLRNAIQCLHESVGLITAA